MYQPPKLWASHVNQLDGLEYTITLVTRGKCHSIEIKWAVKLGFFLKLMVETRFEENIYIGGILEELPNP